MIMAYSDVALLAADYDFQLRVSACIAIETADALEAPNAPMWAAEHAWQMAAQPGFGDAYASAIVGGVPRPGNDPSVITDGQILAAIQSITSP
jgi:hypothetical protein